MFFDGIEDFGIEDLTEKSEDIITFEDDGKELNDFGEDVSSINQHHHESIKKNHSEYIKKGQKRIVEMANKNRLDAVEVLTSEKYKKQSIYNQFMKNFQKEELSSVQTLFDALSLILSNGKHKMNQAVVKEILKDVGVFLTRLKTLNLNKISKSAYNQIQPYFNPLFFADMNEENMGQFGEIPKNFFIYVESVYTMLQMKYC